MSTHPSSNHAGLVNALAAHNASTRLRAAMAAGSTAEPDLVDALIDRCAVEPDFYVRDMLTWALTRLPHREVLARLRPELSSPRPQNRSQALHTLSKIGEPSTWAWVTADLLTDDDDGVARSAWRAAAVLVPAADRMRLAEVLTGQLGRGDRDLQLSLSRALLSIGEVIVPLMEAAATHSDPVVATHARATMTLMEEPDSGFDVAVHEARRIAALGTETA